MKFDDFDLYKAVYSVYLQFEQEDKKPRSSDWFIYKAKRKELRNLVMAKLNLGYSEEKILKAWDDFGKNKEKYKLIIETALVKGCVCKKENEGGCSNTVSILDIDSHRYIDPLTNKPFISRPHNYYVVCKKHAEF